MCPQEHLGGTACLLWCRYVRCPLLVQLVKQVMSLSQICDAYYWHREGPHGRRTANIFDLQPQWKRLMVKILVPFYSPRGDSRMANGAY